MKVKLASLGVLVAMAAYPSAVHAQSASEVIERHVKAIGGKNAVEKIVSTDISGSVRAADGRSGVFTYRTRRPDLFSVDLSWGDIRWRSGFNGRSAWQDDSVDGVRTLYGAAAARTRAEARYANTRFLLPQKVSRVSIAGREQLRGRPVIVIVAITPDGLVRKLFFDSSSYLLAKDEQQTDAGVEERFFDDYRPVDQVMEPHRIEWQRNGDVLSIAVERVVHNATLDAQMFDVPTAPAEPPVDIETLLSVAGRNEQRSESVRASYAYTQSLSWTTMDPHGRTTKREASAFEIFHLDGQPVGRLIRKRDGKALSEGERRREDERVKNIVRESERRRASGQPRRPGQEFGASSFFMNDIWGSLVLRVPVMTAGWFPSYRRMADFSSIRREWDRTRAVVVVDFQPKRGVTPIGDLERQASTMAGTMWIDEASQQVIRIESHFIDDFGSIVQGSSVWMEQTRVNDEVWLPSRLETNLRRSVNFGALLQPLIAVQFTDHKKFSVETDTTVTMPDTKQRGTDVSPVR